ncbi:hypothetical protein MSKU3_0377 [Komagataeibacter oboediens]|nr:hypothetical protein MSKU3_0377 [Komagataeibacter oboediens]
MPNRLSQKKDFFDSEFCQHKNFWQKRKVSVLSESLNQKAV